MSLRITYCLRGHVLRRRRDGAFSRQKNKGRVLFAGQMYYHTWYLSRALRKLGWKADVLNWDPSEQDQIYYHGEDFRLFYRRRTALLRHLKFYAKALFKYDIFHFSNAYGIQFGELLHGFFQKCFGEYSDVTLLKHLGKKVVYSINSCLDGASQASLDTLDPAVCAICKWHEVPSVCSDQRNLTWGRMRNSLADYIVGTAYSPTDYNTDLKVHQVPEFYCLDPKFWSPDLLIPSNYQLPLARETVKIFHSVGNFDLRTSGLTKNLKCTHIYLPLVEQLKREGYNVDLIFFVDVPNKKLRYYQAQADIVVDMLTYGWFGATVREAMMLGKPAVCFLRPEWLEFARREIPEYVDELPVISATPETVHDVVRDLVENPEKRREIGIRSRNFAVKWHSAEVAARKFDQIYSNLLED